jgi:hypothetical protein
VSSPPHCHIHTTLSSPRHHTNQSFLSLFKSFESQLINLKLSHIRLYGDFQITFIAMSSRKLPTYQLGHDCKVRTFLVQRLLRALTLIQARDNIGPVDNGTGVWIAPDCRDKSMTIWLSKEYCVRCTLRHSMNLSVDFTIDHHP